MVGSDDTSFVLCRHIDGVATMNVIFEDGIGCAQPNNQLQTPLSSFRKIAVPFKRTELCKITSVPQKLSIIYPLPAKLGQYKPRRWNHLERFAATVLDTCLRVSNHSNIPAIIQSRHDIDQIIYSHAVDYFAIGRCIAGVKEPLCPGSAFSMSNACDSTTHCATTKSIRIANPRRDFSRSTSSTD